MSLRGKWEGKLVDATGAAVALELYLNDNKGKLSGDFSAYFLVDDPGCCGPQRRLMQSGPVRGTFSAKSKAVRFDYKVTIGLKDTIVQFNGQLSETNNHANQAIVGCYGTTRGDEALTLAGGGAVLWQYREP